MSYSPIVPRQLCPVHSTILPATFAASDTAGCDLKVESMVACQSLFSGGPLDVNAVIKG